FLPDIDSNSSKSLQIPQLNWLQHANAHQNFSSQAKFLSSNFLFSVPRNQKTGLSDKVKIFQVHKEDKLIRPDLLFQAYRHLAGIMSNPESMLKLLLSFTTTGQQLPYKETMRMTSLTVLMSQLTPTVIYNTSRVVDSSVNNHTTYTSQPKESTQFVADNINIDDDDILEGSSTLQTVQEAIPNV
ncbi:hypothetical protein RYX36_033021, partial [Vicia faba]